MRLASEKALLARRFSEHQRHEENARAGALERETALETSLAQVQEELDRERRAREELSSRELKLQDAIVASAVEGAVLR